jgi:tartrate dehydrogenase/decarboxylase / D-malate dehydrogenase
MLRHLGEFQAARAIESAFETVLADLKMRTPDLGGTVSTRNVGQAVALEVSVVPESE